MSYLSIQVVKKITTKFSLEIMTEFCENLLKNQSQVDPKSLQINPKWGPRGILGRPGALPRGQEASGSILIIFWVYFGTHFGTEINETREKVYFGCVKAHQKTEHAFGWLPTSTFDRFSLKKWTNFLEGFLDTFWGSLTRAH